MSATHFFKHLPYHYLLYRRIIPHTPSSLLYSFSLITCKTRTTYSSTPFSFFHKSLLPPPRSSSSSPSPYTTLTESFTNPYLSVRIHCRKQIVDDFSEALLCFGATSISVDEEEVDEDSDEIIIDCIFPEGQEVGVCISQAADSIGLKDRPTYKVKLGDQYDWIQKTQESFHPVQITEGLWIVPEWKTPPHVEATNIILNPGLAFGTGEHPTTKLCLLLLRKLIKGGELFLDYGTGSGVLAIAALKFGASLSVGFDIDPIAIESARQNASLNKIQPEKFQLHLVFSETDGSSMDENTHEVEKEQKTGVTSEGEKYDVVIANILLNPLIEFADHIVSHGKPGAIIAISGILSEQLPHIMGRYSKFLDNISVSEIDGWVIVSGIKKEK